MDTKELAEAKKKMETALGQYFTEFESRSGLRVTGIKIKRYPLEGWIESVTVKAEFPDPSE